MMKTKAIKLIFRVFFLHNKGPFFMETLVDF